jgi:hypothetical protein
MNKMDTRCLKTISMGSSIIAVILAFQSVGPTYASTIQFGNAELYAILRLKKLFGADKWNSFSAETKETAIKCRMTDCWSRTGNGKTIGTEDFSFLPIDRPRE